MSLSAHIIAIQYSMAAVNAGDPVLSLPSLFRSFPISVQRELCIWHSTRPVIKHYEMVCASIEAKYRFIEQHHYHIPNFIAHAEKRIWCLICLSINERWIRLKNIHNVTAITMAITHHLWTAAMLFRHIMCELNCWFAHIYSFFELVCVRQRLRIQLKLNTNGTGSVNEIEIIDKCWKQGETPRNLIKTQIRRDSQQQHHTRWRRQQQTDPHFFASKAHQIIW